jgi:hypothetical protein
MKTIICLVLLSLTLSACRAPILRSDDERFFIEPEVVEALEPYLSEWATLPAEETEAERDRITEENPHIMRITIGAWHTEDGMQVQVVDILLEVWGDWYHGVAYKDDPEVELVLSSHWRWRKLDDHFYGYNYND